MVTNKLFRRVAVAALLFLILGVRLSGKVFAQNTQSDVDAAFERATQLHQSGDLEGAIRGYQAILINNPMRVDVRSNLGAAYSRLGRYEDAIDQYKRALALMPENQTIRYNLAMAYYKAALFAESAAELTRLLSASPTGPDLVTVKLVLADCQVRLGEYKNVVDLLTPLAESDPTNRTVAYLLGSALIGLGDSAKGQAVIDRVFRDDNSAEARLLMGSILLLADEAQNALKEFERALELDPSLPALNAWYGRTLMRLGDAEKARHAFKAELANNPNDFDSNLFLGILSRQGKQTDEAFAYLTRATHLRPRDQYARYNLAAVYVMTGRPKEALPLLEGVVKEYGDFSEARVLLASVYYRLNRKEDGDRQNAVIQKLKAEQQANQPGSQGRAGQNPTPKPSSGPNITKPPQKE